MTIGQGHPRLDPVSSHLTIIMIRLQPRLCPFDCATFSSCFRDKKCHDNAKSCCDVALLGHGFRRWARPLQAGTVISALRASNLFAIKPKADHDANSSLKDLTLLEQDDVSHIHPECVRPVEVAVFVSTSRLRLRQKVL